MAIVWPTRAITGNSFLGPETELGRALKDQVLQGQLAFSSSGRWRGLARRASRRELSDALLNEDLLCGRPVCRGFFLKHDVEPGCLRSAWLS